MKQPTTEKGRAFLFGEWVTHDLHCNNGADACDCGPAELIAEIEEEAARKATAPQW